MLYGVIAEYYQRDLTTAITDYKRELANAPDNEAAVGMLANTQNRSGDYPGARGTMQKFLSTHPENIRIASMLAGLQTNAGDNEGALKTLETAVAHNPDDRNLRIQEGNTLISMGRTDEAVAAAKSALDGADDAEVLNDAAYILSEAGRDLDVAEKATREGIDKLEQQSAAETTAQANSAAFGRANLLVASWDTLGWILYKEGKVQEAQSWLEPAWRASLMPEIGDHLGQIEEGLHHYDAAEKYYALAQGALNGSGVSLDVRGHINAGVSRMKAAGAKHGPSDVAIALQDLRTFKIARPEGAKGWGSFRIIITASGVIESQQMSGDQNLAKIKPVIDAFKFPELVPPTSKAHLLRSAVISCSMGKTCELVLVPGGGLQTERQ
jgi:tetratricopeptide (TPR) repeat protein